MKDFCENCMCELILRMDILLRFCTVGNGEIFSGKTPKGKQSEISSSTEDHQRNRFSGMYL